MNPIIKSLVLVLRSARLALWLPILGNTVVLTLLLGQSLLSGFILGLSLSSVAAYGFLLNDIWDIRVDRENNAGKLEGVSRDVLVLAAGFSGFFLAAGLVISTLLGTRSIFAMLAVAAGLTAYTFWVRPKLFFANLLAAVLASTPVWLPNVIFGLLPDVAQWAIIAITTAILVGREIVFDVADVLGDAKEKRQTFPLFFGDQIARRIAVAMQLSGCGLLIGLTVLQAGHLSFPLQLLLYSTSVAFVILVTSVNIKLLVQPEAMSLIRVFTARTRFAMLLLPILLVLLMGK